MSRAGQAPDLMALDRRTLLRLVGLAGFAVAVPGPALATSAEDTNSGGLLRRFGTPRDAARLARRIRRQHDEHRTAALRQRLTRRLAGLERRPSDASLRRTLRGWIAADFEQDRVLAVDGWNLSETEVGLALVAADLHA